MGNVIPPIGQSLYNNIFLRDYAKCCMAMFTFSMFIAALFYVSFYLLPYSDNTQDAIEKRKRLIDREKIENDAVAKAEQAAKDKDGEKKHGFFCVLKYVLSKRSTRHLFIVYMISKSLHKSMYTFKNVYYLKDIELGGLGFSGDDLKRWHYYAIFPAFIILFA